MEIKSTFGLKEVISDASSRIKKSDRQHVVTSFLQDDICIVGDRTSLDHVLEVVIGSCVAITKSGLVSVVVDHRKNDAQQYNVSLSVQSNDTITVRDEDSVRSEAVASDAIDKCVKIIEGMQGTITGGFNKDFGTKFKFNFLATKSPNPEYLVRALTPEEQAKRDRIMSLFMTSGKNGELMAATDWSKTPLGSLETWPQSLITTVSICLKSRFPMLIWWGPQLTMIYNEDYNSVLGAKHPKSMGQIGSECWPEVFDIIGPMLHGVMQGKGATWSEDQMLPLYRNGFVEECYFTFSYSAIHDEMNDIAGIFTAVFETTKSVVDKRRLNVLKEMGRATAATTVRQAYQMIGDALATLPNCLPFCALYSLENERFIRETVCGIPLDHAACPMELNERCLWPYSEVIETRKAVVVKDIVKRFGSIFCPPWRERITKAMIVPLFSNKQSSEIIGLFITGLSSWVALNEEYTSFIDLIGNRICNIISTMQSYVDQVHRAEELMRLDKAKTQFFTNVSHEFRTPLALMLGPLADSLSDDSNPLNDEQRRRQEMIQSNALRLLKLVNNVLDFARIEAGRTQLNLVPADISEVTKNLSGTFQSVIVHAGLEYIIDIQQVPQTSLDIDMWEKIVLNLLSNAFKFTYRGSITVKLYQEDNSVVFSVADTGVGIAESEQPKIFQRFYRAEQSQGRSFEGSGIGLALVQELVKLHNGYITFKSQVNQGTTFTVVLPIVRTSGRLQSSFTTNTHSTSTFQNVQAAINEIGKWVSQEDECLSVKSLGQNTRAHVLLVDDNVDMRNYLHSILAPHYRVSVAKDGLEALELVENDTPDLILSDVMMPRLDGFGLIKRLRSLPKTNSIPVIVLSARAGEEAKVEGLEIGADDYLVKTAFSEKELLARVKTHFELGQLRSHLEREVARKTEQLTQANTTLSEFIDMICHEIRNPLHGMVGSWQLLSEHLEILNANISERSHSNPATEISEMKDYLTNIKECTIYQARVMDEVVLLAKLFANKFEPRPKVCHLNKLVNKILRRIEDNSNAKNIKFVQHYDIQEAAMNIDARCVKQILMSLLTYIMDSANDGSTLHVFLSLLPRDSDNVALNARVLATNFNMNESAFTRLITLQQQSFANRSVGIHYNNTGFSLAISERLVKVMGGKIEVVNESVDGLSLSGLAFRVTGKQSSKEDERPAPPSNRIFTKRALVAEDNYVNQVLCRALLKKQGYECHIASNGREALEKYQPDYYDFILMDVAMPEINGLEVTKQIRQSEAANNVQYPVFIIGLSAYAQAEKVAEAFAAGMNDFISKPATLDKIIGIIKQWTSH